MPPFGELMGERVPDTGGRPGDQCGGHGRHRMPIGCSGAHRHLERQLHPLPHRPRRGLARAHRRRRPRHPGDQGQGRAVPLRPASTALGYEVAHHGLNQWNGVAILSRVGLDRRRGRASTASPGWGEPLERGGPRDRRHRAAASGCGRSTSPTAAPRATRTWPTSSTGWPGCASRRAAGSPTDPRRVALCGDWNIAPQDEDVWEHGVLPRQEPRVARRARRVPGLPRRRLRRRRPPARARARASTPTGTTSSSRFPKRQRDAHRLRPRLPGAGRPGRPARRSTARSARARAPATTPRSSSSSPDSGTLTGFSHPG